MISCVFWPGENVSRGSPSGKAKKYMSLGGQKEHRLRNAFRLREVAPNRVFRDITVMYFRLRKGVRRAFHSGFSPKSMVL